MFGRVYHLIEKVLCSYMYVFLVGLVVMNHTMLRDEISSILHYQTSMKGVPLNTTHITASPPHGPYLTIHTPHTKYLTTLFIYISPSSTYRRGSHCIHTSICKHLTGSCPIGARNSDT